MKPQSRAEIQPYDTLLLKLREQKISYPDILPQFVEAGGSSSTTNHLAKRMIALKALSVELDDAQVGFYPRCIITNLIFQLEADPR